MNLELSSPVKNIVWNTENLLVCTDNNVYCYDSPKIELIEEKEITYPSANVSYPYLIYAPLEQGKIYK